MPASLEASVFTGERLRRPEEGAPGDLVLDTAKRIIIRDYAALGGRLRRFSISKRRPSNVVRRGLIAREYPT